MGGGACGGAGRRAGPPRADPGECGQRRRARSTAPVRADGPGPAFRARHVAESAGAAAAGPAGDPRAPGGGGAGTRHPPVRAARGPGPDPGAARAGRGRRRGADGPHPPARRGEGGTMVLTGPPGVGKSAMLDLTESIARQRGWRTGRGTASAVEGPWPYAPVLEALSDMCRKHPALCDGLPDEYRDELERALSGRDVSWSGESAHQRLFVAAAELIRLASSGHGLLLVVDDLHDADQASLRLLHYLSRCAVAEQVLIVLAHRPALPAATREVVD